MWPLRTSERPPSPAGCQSATTFRLPDTSHENGEAAGCERSIASSSGMSTGSRPISRRAARITSWPGSSFPSTVGASIRRDSTSSM